MGNQTKLFCQSVLENKDLVVYRGKKFAEPNIRAYLEEKRTKENKSYSCRCIKQEDDLREQSAFKDENITNGNE